MKAITLLNTCFIAGVPRSPIEGVQTVTEAEADRLVEMGQAEYADGVEALEVEDDLDGMTVAQLKEVAGAEEIDLGDATRKDDVLDAIRSARAERSTTGDRA